MRLLRAVSIRPTLYLVMCVLLAGGWRPASAGPHTPAAAPTTWSTTVIDSAGEVGAHLSLAVSPATGRPHIAYYDFTHADLKLAFPAAGGDCGPANTWSCNSLHFSNVDDFGRWPAIAFTPAGQWGIAYQSAFNAAIAYRGVPAAGASELFWTDIDESGGLNTLAFAEAGHAEVAYGTIVSATITLGYARYVGAAGNCGAGKWNCQAVDDLTAESFQTGLSLATRTGFPPNTLIAYRGDDGGLEVAAHPPPPGEANCGFAGLIATWYCIMVDPASGVGAVSIATHANDIYIAYVDRDTEKLKFAEFVGGSAGNCGGDSWRCVVIDDAYVESGGYGVSLALFNGAPAIAYSGRDAQGRSVVKYARPLPAGNCGRLPPLNIATWQCDVVDDGQRTGGYHDVGNAVALAFGPLGRAYIAYHDATDGDLLLAEPVTRLFLPLLSRP